MDETSRDVLVTEINKISLIKGLRDLNEIKFEYKSRREILLELVWCF